MDCLIWTVWNPNPILTYFWVKLLLYNDKNILVEDKKKIVLSRPTSII